MKKILYLLLLFFLFTTNVYADGIDLFELIKDSASTDTIDFNYRSGESLTNGVYITTDTDSGTEVYYYRGTVNNNIIYNNMCFKIIRTTETGGIKLIYNGLPTDGKCNNTGSDSLIGTSEINTNFNDNGAVGYMYGTYGSNNKEDTHENLYDSTIKTYIDNWFSINFTDSDILKNLEDTVFCSDRTTVSFDTTHYVEGNNFPLYGDLGYGTNPTFYGATRRAWVITKNLSPSLKCSQDNDKFTVSNALGNGKLTYPVGLITADELIYAGFGNEKYGISDTVDNTSYLYINTVFWTMTPIWFGTSGKASLAYGSASGYADSGMCNVKRGVRPVISLNGGIAIDDSTDGSGDNPYVLSYYTVKFNHTGKSVISNEYISIDTPSKVTKPNDPIKEGYKFLGWYNGDTLYDFDTLVTNPIILTAKWEKIETKNEDNPYTYDDICKWIILDIIFIYDTVLLINLKKRVF